MLSMLAVHGLPERFPQYTESVLKSLIRVLVLPTLQSHQAKASVFSAASGIQAAPSSSSALEVAAAQSATALWALSSNPQCASWGSILARDEASLSVLLAVVKRGQRGSTKARFFGSRLISALTLSQLAAQGADIAVEIVE